MKRRKLQKQQSENLFHNSKHILLRVFFTVVNNLLWIIQFAKKKNVSSDITKETTVNLMSYLIRNLIPNAPSFYPLEENPAFLRYVLGIN